MSESTKTLEIMKRQMRKNKKQIEPISLHDYIKTG